MGIVRVRYPRDPFTEFAEVVWWTGHPFVAWVLDKMPAAHGEKLKGLILRTGDLSLVNGHLVLLAAEEQQRLAAACEEMDRHLPEILARIEQQYGDAQRLAWTGTPVIQ
jgi:DNA-binding GntR family transcriptional regulator